MFFLSFGLFIYLRIYLLLNKLLPSIPTDWGRMSVHPEMVASQYKEKNNRSHSHPQTINLQLTGNHFRVVHSFNKVGGAVVILASSPHSGNQWWVVHLGPGPSVRTKLTCQLSLINRRTPHTFTSEMIATSFLRVDCTVWCSVHMRC